MHSPDSKGETSPGHLIVLGSGPRAEWEYAMQRLANAGPLLVVDHQKPTAWQRPHIVSARVANPLNPSEVLDAAQKLAMRYPIAGVLHFHPAHTRAVALVRQKLSLPGTGADILRVSSTRHRTAELLDLADVESSTSRHASSYDQALEAAHHVGLPLICKPASPRRRYAARVVNSLEEMGEAFSAATAATWPAAGVVIERLLEGIEATAYTFGTGDATHVIAISHATFDPQAAPILLPIQVVVDAEDVCAAQIKDIARRAAAAIGHHHGPAQIRLRITATGPRVISISTHLTDPLIGHLIEQVTSVDLIAASGEHARGQIPSIECSPLGATAVRYLQAPYTAAASRYRNIKAGDITPFTRCDSYDTDRRVGPLKRSGHLLASGTDYPQCIERLRGATAGLTTSA